MTAPSAVVTPDAPDDQLFCYRHPARETWVRCGRCDRPICTQCAIQGPVGLRCRQCGKPAFDPLTSFSPLQLTLGIGTSLLAGIALGFLAGQVGFFSIIVAWFAGTFIADLVRRATGYKRGPVMLAILIVGIGAGTLVGAFGSFWMQYGMIFSALGADQAEARDAALAILQPFLLQEAAWAVLTAGVAIFAAWQRARW